MITVILSLFKLPTNNGYLLSGAIFVIFTISYVAMAWYDYYFDCQAVPLKKGQLSLQQYFKPPAHNQEKQYTGDQDKQRTLIYASHVLFIAPFMCYFVYYQDKAKKEAYAVLAALSAMTLLYHGYKLIALLY